MFLIEIVAIVCLPSLVCMTYNSEITPLGTSPTPVKICFQIQALLCLLTITDIKEDMILDCLMRKITTLNTLLTRQKCKLTFFF